LLPSQGSFASTLLIESAPKAPSKEMAAAEGTVCQVHRRGIVWHDFQHRACCCKLEYEELHMIDPAV
jgi:hypothetical protein